MAAILVNRDKILLILPLNSGRTIYLAPGESSGQVEELEFHGNPKIEKLLRSGLLELAPAKHPAAPSTPRPRKTESSRGTT